MARLLLIGAALAGVLVGCVQGPDDSEQADPPVDQVAWIESSEGTLWLGHPPASLPVRDNVLDKAARSIAAVRASGCGPQSNGTAFAVARGLLVGAAHVLAGSTDIEIEWRPSGADDGIVYPAVVVGFDSARDLALLRTDAPVPPLRIGRARLVPIGVVLGFPESGKFTASPARIEHFVRATGLWGDRTARSVYVLAADVRTGQSGAPLIDLHGQAVGVAFATVRGPNQVGFALSRGEMLDFLASSGVEARVDYRSRSIIGMRASDLSEVPNTECERR